MNSMKFARLVFLSLALACAHNLYGHAFIDRLENETAGSQPVTPPARPKVLYLIHSAGFKHAVLPLSGEIMKEMGDKSGAFEAVVSEDCSLIDAEKLRQFAAVVFYTTGELPISDSQKAALIEFVK